MLHVSGPVRSLSYNDEDPNDSITFFIQKNGEQALKEIAVSEINCEFDMIQPVDLREAMKDKIRTNSNLIPMLLPYKRQQLPTDRKSTRLNSSHSGESRMPSSA